jgi:hypothetical protein
MKKAFSLSFILAFLGLVCLTQVPRAQMMTLGYGLGGKASGAATSTWNGSDKGTLITLSGGNLTATGAYAGGASFSAGVRGTASHSSGKWYFEVKPSSTTANIGASIGIATSAFSVATATSNLAPGVNDSISAGYFCHSGTPGAVASTNTQQDPGTVPCYAVNQFVGVAVDVPNHTIWWSLNGTYIDGPSGSAGNPAAGTNGYNYTTLNPVFPLYSFEPSSIQTDAVILNVGATSFNTAAPSGFSAWQ